MSPPPTASTHTEVPMSIQGIGNNSPLQKIVNQPIQKSIPDGSSQPTRGTIPWANRATIGRVRGYWRTVWLATARARALAAEITRPVSWREAQRFRFLTVCLASITPIALYVGALQMGGGTPSLFPDL